MAELEHVTKRYGDKRVVEDFSTRILRGDKIGLIGPNGCGKSTLLKLILGEPRARRRHRAPGHQGRRRLLRPVPRRARRGGDLADTISPGSDFVEIDGTRKHVISYLGDFLFPPERAGAPVKTLSGGERNRLLLARLFSRPANVLVLDEPTNDLDIETLELLETLLQDYAGTLFLVSHDRAFLDNVVTQTIAYEGDGRWKEYAGGYSGLAARAQDACGRARRGARPSAGEAAAPKADTRGPRRSAKLTFNEARELDELPGKARGAGARAVRARRDASPIPRSTRTAAWTSRRSTRATPRSRRSSPRSSPAGRSWRRRRPRFPEPGNSRRDCGLQRAGNGKEGEDMGPIRIGLVVVAALGAAAAAWYYWPAEPRRGASRAGRAGHARARARSRRHPSTIPSRRRRDAEAADALARARRQRRRACRRGSRACWARRRSRSIFVPERLVRNIVVTIDNLPRKHLRHAPEPGEARSGGLVATTGKDESLAIAPENAARYAPWVTPAREGGREEAGRRSTCVSTRSSRRPTWSWATPRATSTRASCR